jgi:hypothetical protein
MSYLRHDRSDQPLDPVPRVHEEQRSRPGANRRLVACLFFETRRHSPYQDGISRLVAQRAAGQHPTALFRIEHLEAILAILGSYQNLVFFINVLEIDSHHILLSLSGSLVCRCRPLAESGKQSRGQQSANPQIDKSKKQQYKELYDPHLLHPLLSDSRIVYRASFMPFRCRKLAWHTFVISAEKRIDLSRLLTDPYQYGARQAFIDPE